MKIDLSALYFIHIYIKQQNLAHEYFMRNTPFGSNYQLFPLLRKTVFRELEEHRRGRIKSRCTSNQSIIWDKTTLVTEIKKVHPIKMVDIEILLHKQPLFTCKVNFLCRNHYTVLY